MKFFCVTNIFNLHTFNNEKTAVLISTEMHFVSLYFLKLTKYYNLTFNDTFKIYCCALSTSSPAHLFTIRGRRKRWFFKKFLWERGWDYSQIRLKHENAIRHAGGITVLANNHVRFGLNPMEDTYGFLWFQLEKSLFQLENDIFHCGAYIPPNNNTPANTTKTDYFGKLNDTLIKYKDKGKS